jgi:hypothetical protein
MKFKTNTNIVMYLFMLAALLFVPATSWSQDDDEVNRQIGQLDISKTDVNAFAEAQHKVAELREEYTAIVSEITDIEEQRTVVREANEKIVAAVEQTGLSVERYNEIMNALQTDTELQQRIIKAQRNI